MPQTASQVLDPSSIVGSAQSRCLRFGDERAVRVALAGELDVATAPRVERVLRRAQDDAELVVLDLRGLWFMDCRGAHLVVAAHRRARRTGGRLVVVRGPAEIDWFFELLGLDHRLELVDRPPAGTAGPDDLRMVPA